MKNISNHSYSRGYVLQAFPVQYPGLQLTPAGLAAKSRATARFLARKQAEYERLAAQIEELRHEVPG